MPKLSDDIAFFVCDTKDDRILHCGQCESKFVSEDSKIGGKYFGWICPYCDSVLKSYKRFKPKGKLK